MFVYCCFGFQPHPFSISANTHITVGSRTDVKVNGRMNFCLIFLRVLCLNSKSNLALDFQLAGFHLSVQSSWAISQSGQVLLCSSWGRSFSTCCWRSYPVVVSMEEVCLGRVAPCQAPPTEVKPMIWSWAQRHRKWEPDQGHLQVNQSCRSCAHVQQSLKPSQLKSAQCN